jgi:hypothetical protein
VIAPTRGKCVPTDFLAGVRPKVWLSDRLPAQCTHAEAHQFCLAQASEFTYPSAQAFFNASRTHTTEGMFADPWRQQGRRRLEAGRLSRSPIVLHRRGHAKQAGVRTRATEHVAGMSHGNRKD